jgi:hypothetical protein
MYACQQECYPLTYNEARNVKYTVPKICLRVFETLQCLKHLRAHRTGEGTFSLILFTHIWLLHKHHMFILVSRPHIPSQQAMQVMCQDTKAPNWAEVSTEVV